MKRMNDDNVLAQFFGKSSNYTDIPNGLFAQHNVKKGLRNEDGTGVRVGLTKVSDVVGYKVQDGRIVPTEGNLYFRGYSIRDLLNNRQGCFGYEETVFLLLFGFLPNRNQFQDFKESLSRRYELPDDFLVNEVLRSPSKNLMNRLQTLTLSLYNYDEDDPDNTDVYEVLKKGINLVAKFPALAVYSYQAKMHNMYHKSLIIHYPKPEYSIAENILYMLRPDGRFTQKEAELLDAMLVLHADHGGGNNSTFTNVVIGSTGTDLYSSIAGSIGSLKGPKHGGANVSVQKMMNEVIGALQYTTDEEKVRGVVDDLLNGGFYDHSGLVYGFGHAVYTLSDPRCELIRDLCQKLAEAKGLSARFNFYALFEKVAHEEISKRTKKPVPTNVDYYSGFAYTMLGIPEDLFTPLFAIARSAGWIAHNVENKLYDGRIMRPATKYVGKPQEYVPMNER